MGADVECTCSSIELGQGMHIIGCPLMVWLLEMPDANAPDMRGYPDDMARLPGDDFWSSEGDEPARVTRPGMGETQNFWKQWEYARQAIIARMNRRRDEIDRETCRLRNHISRLNKMHAPEES